MFSILTSSMSRSISRYLTFELGKKGKRDVSKVFSTSINIQVFFSIIICLLIETVGVWFLNNKLVIPHSRIFAANFTLQCALVNMVIGLFCIPYNAAIIAHERMGAFAYISILETIIKLVTAIILYFYSADKLILYSTLGICGAIIIRVVYAIYCKKHFDECTYHFTFDLSLTKEMSSFAGLSFIDNGTYILNNQGINILINIFFGVTANAARGISMTIDGVVRQFVGNLLTAINPQIIKSYASGDLGHMHKLVYVGAKLACFIIIFLGIPFIMETHLILNLWLGIIPENAISFVRLSLLLSICMLIGDTLSTAVCATGHIKKYQLWNSFFASLVFPVTFLFYKYGGSVSCFYYIYITISIIMIFVRNHIVSKQISMSKREYNTNVVARVFLVLAISSITPVIILCNMPESIFRLLFLSSISMVVTSITIFFIGLNCEERAFFKALTVKAIRNASSN